MKNVKVIFPCLDCERIKNHEKIWVLLFLQKQKCRNSLLLKFVSHISAACCIRLQKSVQYLSSRLEQIRLFRKFLL